MENFNWEEIKEKLQKAVNMENKRDDLSIKITIKESNIEENELIGNMLKSEVEMKQLIARFVNQGNPVECEVEVDQNQKFILIKFRDEQMWKKTYDLFNDMFFGNYLKKMIEAMMGAFGRMFGPED